MQAWGFAIAQRFAGHDRGDTAALFATWAVANLGFSTTTVALARGDDFADALAGALATGDPVVTLLTDGPDNLWPSTSKYLLANTGLIDSLVILGGTTAITPANVSKAARAALGQVGWAITKASPESFVMPDQAGGVFTLTGSFPGPAEVHFRVSDGNRNSTQACGLGVTTDVTSTSRGRTGTLFIPVGCPPGPYDVEVGPAGSSQFQASLAEALTVILAVTSVSPSTVANDNASHLLRVSGRGFLSGASVFVSPSADNKNAPTAGCGSSTNAVDAAVQSTNWNNGLGGGVQEGLKLLTHRRGVLDQFREATLGVRFLDLFEVSVEAVPRFGDPPLFVCS